MKKVLCISAFVKISMILLSTLFAQTDKNTLWQGYKADSRVKFILAEDFEKPALFNVSRKATGENTKQVQSVVARPSLKHEKIIAEAMGHDTELLAASNLIRKESTTINTAWAQEFRIFVNSPGHDNFTFLFRKPRTYSGEPRIAVIYLRGNKRRHKVYLLASVYDKIEREVFITDLNFAGWKRFEIIIPATLRKRNPRRSNYFDFSLHGLRVKSYFREEQSLVTFAADQLMVLTDISDMQIPGAELKDDWK